MSLNRADAQKQKEEIIRQIKDFITAAFSKDPNTRNSDSIYKALDQSTLTPEEKLDCLSETFTPEQHKKWWENSWRNVTFGMAVALTEDNRRTGAEGDRFINYLLRLKQEGASRYQIHAILKQQLSSSLGPSGHLYGFLYLSPMSQAKLSYLMIDNDLIPREWFKNITKKDKESLLQFILSLPLTEREAALQRAIDPATSLGQLFWVQRLLTAPSKNKGTLAKIYSELEKIKLARKEGVLTGTPGEPLAASKELQNNDPVAQVATLQQQVANDQQRITMLEQQVAETRRLVERQHQPASAQVVYVSVPYPFYPQPVAQPQAAPGSLLNLPLSSSSQTFLTGQSAQKASAYNSTAQIFSALPPPPANAFQCPYPQSDALSKLSARVAVGVDIPAPFAQIPQSLLDDPTMALPIQATAALPPVSSTASVLISPQPSFEWMSADERVRRYLSMYQSSLPLFTSEVPAIAASAGAAAPIVGVPSTPSVQIQKSALAFAR